MHELATEMFKVKMVLASEIVKNTEISETEKVSDDL